MERTGEMETRRRCRSITAVVFAAFALLIRSEALGETTL